MGVGKTLYNILFLCHLVAVIVGFGAVSLNGVYGNLARKRGGPEGLAISEANLFVTEKVAAMAIYSVPVFGILLVVVSKKAWKFEQAWVSASLVLYILLLVLALAVINPTHRRINALAGSRARAGEGGGGRPGTAQQGELATLGQRMAVAGSAFDLILVVVIILMIWKPGS